MNMMVKAFQNYGCETPKTTTFYLFTYVSYHLNYSSYTKKINKYMYIYIIINDWKIGFSTVNIIYIC